MVKSDIATSVMTLSSFRSLPCQGHLESAHRVCSYLYRMNMVWSDLAPVNQTSQTYLTSNWTGKNQFMVKYMKISPKAFPQDIPAPLANIVTLSHYVDAHNMTSSHSITGILHLVNQTPTKWYSKKQATAETATYISEFKAASNCVELVIDLLLTLH